ncbi:MAG: hypothetical protein HY257_08745 [Chloroflexi bacterium]|nr:hypothetical protein [Chloroflexota bacterium]
MEMKTNLVVLLLFASLVHSNPVLCFSSMGMVECAGITSNSSAPIEAAQNGAPINASAVSLCSNNCVVQLFVPAFDSQESVSQFALQFSASPYFSSPRLTDPPPRI